MGMQATIGNMNTINLNQDLDLCVNKLDKTANVYHNKDDSMNTVIKLIHQRRRSKNIQGINPKSLSKIQKMLSNNIAMKQNREVDRDISRAEKMRKLMAAVAGSPKRGAFSNIRERPNNTIEVDYQGHNRAFSPALRLRNNAPINSNMKNRINQKLDMLMRQNRNKDKDTDIKEEVSKFYIRTY
jgi:hypothetical protein